MQRQMSGIVLRFRNIRIIFNIIEENGINPVPIDQAYNRNK